MNGYLHSVKASTHYKREHKQDYGREKISILHEDDAIVIIYKPNGMLSVPYPGSKARTAIAVLEQMMRSKGTYTKAHRPFVVHRLDRDTSGIMMFALTEALQKKIMANWHHMVTERLYRAVAENPRNPDHILPESGLIDAPLVQNAHHVSFVPHNPDKDAVPARTHYTVIERGISHTLFELSLDTGKKNQIRAHLASKEYPLAGDENYRARSDPFHRLALHACTLAFIHPVTNKAMRFAMPEPHEWLDYVRKGDRHPEPPLWRTAKTQYLRPATYESVEAPQVPRKQLRQMDFIAQGKALHNRSRH